MAELICLANSWRPGGRCIAGIDRSTGLWVRPVTPAGGAIPERCTVSRGRWMAPLDIVEIETEPPIFGTRFQRENCIVRSWNWRLLGYAEPVDVLQYCVTAKTILHGAGKVVEPVRLAPLPPEQWTSLELVHATRVVFEPDPFKKRWDARFSMARFAPEYCLPLTDPAATQKLAAGGRIAAECLLTVSLTAPIEYPQFDKPALCYKLVAAVIEVKRRV